MTIRDLPDFAIQAILTHYFVDPSTDRSAFEVCKRFNKLGKHLILKKLVIRTGAHLDNFVCGLHSPLYDEHLSQLVEELELAALPGKGSLRSWKPSRYFSLPNLQVVRFSLRYGLSLSGDQGLEGDSINHLLLSQTVHEQSNANQHWQRFLTQLNPLRFEWTCPVEELGCFRLVSIANLRHVFSAWTRLQLVVLDRICLIELHDLDTAWTISTPAPQVIIKGPISDFNFLYDTGRMRDSTLCSFLVFENTVAGVATGAATSSLGGQIPIVSLGHTLVSVRNFNFWLYQRLVRHLAGVSRWNLTLELIWRSITSLGTNWYGGEQPESGSSFSSRPNPLLLSHRGIAISLLFLFLVVFSRRPGLRIEDESGVAETFTELLGPPPEVEVVSVVVGTEPDAVFSSKGGRCVEMPATPPPAIATIPTWNPLRLHGGLL